VGIWDAFVRKSGLTDPDFRSTVLTISCIPYGRTASPTAAGVVHDWRGTCSTKHLLLRDLVGERWQSIDVQLWHRVYRLTPELARAKWGPTVASTVPFDGLIDVHNYATVRVAGAPVIIDVTFPITMWDGTSPMSVASGPGEDQPAGHDLMAEKQRLVTKYCEPAKREPFITALSGSMGTDQ
jgi:hypothetical protein